MKKILLILLVGAMIFFTGCQRTYNKKTFNRPNITDETEASEIEPEFLTEPVVEPYTEFHTEATTEPPTEAPTEPPLINPETGVIVPSYIFTLNNAARSAGYDNAGPKDEHNRPLAVISLQNEYGNPHNTLFIGEDSRKIYLTFVEGTEYRDSDGVRKTEKLLNILKENDVKATFFCTGSYIMKNADLCMRMINEGHAIGGHGYAHMSGGMALQPVSVQYNDAYQMKKTARKILGIELKLYRPDYERFSHQSLAILNEMGFKTVMQSFSYKDYLLNEHPDNEETLNLFKNSIHYGEIMGLHPLCDTNIEILPDFINYAKEQGYIFDVISS